MDNKIDVNHELKKCNGVSERYGNNGLSVVTTIAPLNHAKVKGCKRHSKAEYAVSKSPHWVVGRKHNL